eukprot:m.362861 g.362861  ORF g.362861 m.362861 type:complete len:60 (+) comp21035_c0_seq1:219-398(+)
MQGINSTQSKSMFRAEKLGVFQHHEINDLSRQVHQQHTKTLSSVGVESHTLDSKPHRPV